VADSNNQDLRIIYDYLAKETLTSDLIQKNLIILENNYLDKKTKCQSNQQEKFLIRIAIESEGKLRKLWQEDSFLQSYSTYYLSTLSDKGLCYVSGENQILTTMHGKGIRWAGDGAKLISSNDTSNFTFKGRFEEATDAVGIGYDQSEKAHSALRYLIQNQAYKNNGYVVVAFGKGIKLIQPTDDTEIVQNALYANLGLTPEPEIVETEKNYAEELNKALNGYRHKLDPQRQVTIMALDNATPGRLAIQYYKELTEQEYVANVIYYHDTISWLHFYKKDGDKRTYKHIGAPAQMDLINYVFGTEREGLMSIGDRNKYRNQLLRRLLPCVTERAKIPRDFVDKAFEAAITPLKKSHFNWRKSVSIACGLIKKYYFERDEVEYSMALDRNLDDRSYLFGRLLAVAEKIEREAMHAEKKDEDFKRQTNAMRYMNALAKKPYKTWMLIELKLQPYLKRLTLRNRTRHQIRLGEIMSNFKIDDYKSNKSLEGTFLLGFHCQLQDYYTKKNESENEFENETVEG